MVKISTKGSFDKTFRFFNKSKKFTAEELFKRYGEAGVAALAANTPVDTGLTADSWYYEIRKQRGRTTLYFSNSNVQDYVNIAIILQFGHATRSGSYVEGVDYINPALARIFDDMAKNLWMEVKAL